MGGYMPYQRMRSRNRLMFRKPAGDSDPYWRSNAPYDDYPRDLYCLIGDMNRMEQDYLGTSTCANPMGLLEEVVEKTGVDRESVLKVLRYVLMEQI